MRHFWSLSQNQLLRDKVPFRKSGHKYIYILYLFIYLFHPRYLHNDIIFRYMQTLEITQDISRLLFHVVLPASSLPQLLQHCQTHCFSRFFQLPSRCSCSTELEQLLKYQLGGGGKINHLPTIYLTKLFTTLISIE